MREAIAIWLRVVLDIITVWSSASIHTFEEVAAIVGVNLEGPIAGAPDRSGLGAAHGAAIFGKDGTSWVFEYETTLDYLIQNENEATFARNTPYGFQVIADKAAIDYIIQQIDARLIGIVAENLTARKI